MRRYILLFTILSVSLFVGYTAGWLQANGLSTTRLDRVVVMSWGDGKSVASFYGAHVYLELAKGGYSVRARVYIGRGYGYFQDCGELGTVQTADEAVARWGTINWQEDGLHIGNGTNQFFLAKTQLENHR